MKKFLQNSSKFLTRRQTSILSAATVIMVMIAASRILGLVRNRILAHFFSVDTLSVYFAAFRLPEVIFEVLVFGALSSAFIPTFTRFLVRKQEDEAWYVASVCLNFAFLFFAFLSLLIFVFAQPLYHLIAPGFNPAQVNQVVRLTRILILAQGFFVLSYFLTGVLESLRRFLVPALAPIFYNLGIILGTVFLAKRIGIYAPTVGAVLGAFFHFLIQVPLAFHLGFRPRLVLDTKNPGVREIGRLALPRIIELSFLQLEKNAELFLASLVSVAAYTHYTFASSLQLLPIGLFGMSIAKASLPTLSIHSVNKDRARFKEIFIASFNEIAFLIIPCSVFLAVLRVPIVRLVFGASRFGWQSTVQTGYTLSAFCLGIFARALIYLLNRAFYALHDTKTPVKIAIMAIFIHIILGAFFIIGLKLPIWSLAFAFSLASVVQFGFLFVLLVNQKLQGIEVRKLSWPFLKIVLASSGSGGLMFFLLKLFDRPTWVKKLSLPGRLGLSLPIAFSRFTIDTRYTGNLIILTFLVGIVGLTAFFLLSWLLRIKEASVFAKVLLKLKQMKFSSVGMAEKEEPITLSSE